MSGCPNAKFIHIYRSLYDVYSSTKNPHRKILAFTTLQQVDVRSADETVLTLYEIMMQRFFADRKLIPEANFAEVRFEDLERDPLGELGRLYQTLDLPGFSRAEPVFQAYIDSQKAYRKNDFELSAEDCGKIEQRWAFAFAGSDTPRQLLHLLENTAASGRPSKGEGARVEPSIWRWACVPLALA